MQSGPSAHRLRGRDRTARAWRTRPRAPCGGGGGELRRRRCGAHSYASLTGESVVDYVASDFQRHDRCTDVHATSRSEMDRSVQGGVIVKIRGA